MDEKTSPPPCGLKWGGEGEALKYFRAALVEAVEVGVKTWGVGVGLEISGLFWDIESFSISRESPFASAGHRLREKGRSLSRAFNGFKLVLQHQISIRWPAAAQRPRCTNRHQLV